jgi:hypothetical protein
MAATRPVERRTVAFDGALEFQALSLAHDRHAMIADVAAEDDLVAAAGAICRYADVMLDHADTGCGDEDLVAFTAVDDLGIAGDELYAGLSGGSAHGLDDRAQIVDRQAFFEDEGGREIHRAGAAHRQIVHRPVNRAPADIAARKKDWRYDEGVGGEGEPRAADGDHGLIVEPVERGIAKDRNTDSRP